MAKVTVRQALRDKFFPAFHAQVECIAAMEVPARSRAIVPFENMRALLICAHLDTLAQARYGVPSSGKKFRRLLEQEVDYDAIYGLVALERLANRLDEMKTDPRALAAVDALLNERWQSETATVASSPAARSMRPNVVEDHLRAAGLTILPRTPLAKALEAERYSSIVWSDYRCTLVHQVHVANKGFDLQEDREPYYFTQIEADRNPSRVLPLQRRIAPA